MTPLMVVSARADTSLRSAVAAGARPCPEYLRLESRHGFELLDWSRIERESGGRSAVKSLRQAAIAARRGDRHGVVLSDGEPVGLPLAVAHAALRTSARHVMIGHRLSSPKKRALFSLLRLQVGIDRILVHASAQRDAACRLHIESSRVRRIDYAVDSDFWSPQAVEEEPLVVSAGREHRDFETLARACSDLQARFFVTAASAHSPDATARVPRAWPGNVEQGRPDYLRLRELYARASVIVVPMLPCDFQAGITALLEGMAMGKPVVVSATEGLSDVIDPEVCLPVPTGDPGRMRDAIDALLADPARRRRLGQAARERVERRHRLDDFCDALARHAREVSCGS